MKRGAVLFIILTLLAGLLGGCGTAVAREYEDWTLTLSGDGIEGELVYTLGELAREEGMVYEAVYSTINNWPNPGSYAGQGLLVANILEKAGVLDTAQTVTFMSEDGYKAGFTREQLLDTPQYCYANPGVDGNGAVRVYPIIAFNWQQGGTSLDQLSADAPCLIVGQSDYLQHNNPVFVEGVSRILVSDTAERWDPPYIWPEDGRVQPGDSVKLQHDFYSMVKIHYTLDGSQPTVYSPMYNPSTYQPELNRPIQLGGTGGEAEGASLVIKAFVTGYGRLDSQVAEFPISVSREE